MVEIFGALSDKSRLRILSLLMYEDKCVCEIEVVLNLTQSNASRHLIELKRTGMLDSYKKAQWTYYKINQTFMLDNKELWEYLKEEFKKISIYEDDYKESLKYKSINLCSSKNIH